MTRNAAQKAPRPPLEAKTKSGAARCQAAGRTHDDNFRQCGNPARKGMRVCRVHGAGSPKREREGRAENPATVNVEHGHRAKPGTIALLRQKQDPAFRALFEHHLVSENLTDLRWELAHSRALIEYYLSQANLSDTDGTGRVPAMLAAVDRREKNVKIVLGILRAEQEQGVITREQLEYYWAIVAETLDVFVPRDKHDAVRTYLYERLHARESGSVGFVPPDVGRGGDT